MNNITKKIVAIATILTMMAGPALGATVAELQAQIDALLAQLASLQSELTELQGETPTVSGCTISSFDRNLKEGMSGDDVNCLQIVLNSSSDTQLADSGVGSSGNETSYFGPLTKAAVIKFQEKYADDVLASWGLTSGTGFVGSTTRAKLDSLLTAPAEEEEEEAEVPAEGLSVVLAADTPAAATVPGNGTVPFLKVLLTASDDGDATVTGMNLRRVGLGSNNDFAKVWVVADGSRRGSMRAMTSSDTVALVFTGNHAVTVPAGTTKAVTVYANVGSITYAGHNSGLELTSVNSDAASVTGLPVTGNLMTIATTAAVSTTVSKLSVGTTRDIGDTDVEVARVKVLNTNAGEDVTVNSITLKSIAPSSGTKVDTDDVVDFELYVDDALVAGPVQTNSQGYVVFDLDDPQLIEKGGTKYEVFVVKADIASGPGRKLTLDIVEITSGKNIDVEAYSVLTGFRTYNTDTFTTTEITISATDLAVSTDVTNNPKSRTVLDNLTVTLLKGYLNASKGPVTVTNVRIVLTGSDMDFGTTDEFESLRFYLDDVLISEATGSEISTSDDETSINVDLTDEFGVSGKLPFEVTINAKVVDALDTLKATVAGSAMTATRDVDSASVSPTGTATGNTVTFGAGALTIARSATPVSVTRVAGSTDVDFLGFTLFASTADDITVTKLVFELDSDGTEVAGDVDTVRIYASDGTTLIAGPKNLDSSKQAVFSGLDLDIPKGDTIKYILTSNINPTINDSAITELNFEMPAGGGVTAEESDGDELAAGAMTGETDMNNTGTTKITIEDRGTLDVYLSTSTPSTHQVMANDTGDITTIIKFDAAYEDVNIKKLVFTTVAGAGSDDEVKKLTLECDQGFTTVSSEAIATGIITFNLPETNYVVVPAGDTTTCTLKTDYNSTLDSVADSGAIVQWELKELSTDVEAEGAVKDIYAAVYEYNGTGVTLGTPADNSDLTADASATATTLTVASTTNYVAGDICFIEDNGTSGTFNVGTDEYALILSVDSATQLTVRRGVAGTTAIPIVAADADSVWHVDQLLYLYVGSHLIDTDATDITASGTDITFDAISGSVYSILGTATEFTVKVQVAEVGTGFVTGSSMKLSLDAFGSADAAGTITAGDMDWEDGVNSGTQIEWIDTDLTSVTGNTFQLIL